MTDSKAFVTFAVGSYVAFLDIARPSFVAYAARHGYDYIEAEATEIDASRPPSWSKVPVLLGALATHEAVLWVDCDAIVVNDTDDIAANMPLAAHHALACHYQKSGPIVSEYPSCGTWFLRQAMISVLQQAWQMTEYLRHPWWEQAAIHELMGYIHNGTRIFPIRLGEETELRHNTHFLPSEWASVDFDNPEAQARVMHVPGVIGHEERLTVMRYWAARALQQGQVAA